MPPVVVADVDDRMQIMQEEVFGPLLPLRTYHTLDEAIAQVNTRPRPLALYYFSENPRDVQIVLERTVSGGACINDVMLQFAENNLPFGGVGDSGTGAYHGRDGFERFSHKRAIFEQSARSATGLLEPPYGKRFKLLLRLLSR
jgi:acyl-CoA reductase-like NAD-dependent aldehyde dehydrogenase